MDKYFKQTPEQNCEMFEELSKVDKGTWYYPMWAKERKGLAKKNAQNADSQQ